MHNPLPGRYQNMIYNRSGKSGLLLPSISLGLWQNFGAANDYSIMRQIILGAFDKGITHFDLANNYGPPGGEAEINFGKILNDDFKAYRDELLISTKAGYYMWPGPYGEWGSRKYLMASIDQSLRRMGIPYVDIFYSHRFDPNTAMEETMSTLDSIVKSGKALYAGISNYDAEQTKQAASILRSLGTPCIIHQPRYSMLDRWVENKENKLNQSLLDVVDEEGMGCIVFSPLAQGRLSDKYLNGIPVGSRIARNLGNGAIDAGALNERLIKALQALNQIAHQRNQSLAQMAIAWLLKDKRVSSVLVGASSLDQLHNSINALNNTAFTSDELNTIEIILKEN